MRLVPTRCTRSHAPFSGSGASLYLGVGSADAISYRNLRAWPVGGTFTAGAGSKIGGTNTQKTARVASVSSPTTTITYAIPSTYWGQTVYLQVRTFASDCENETILNPQAVTLDGSGNSVNAILGTALLLAQTKLDGGQVRLRFRYVPAVSGIQPTQFRAHRTAGPTSPADATVSYSGYQQIYEIDTPALSDASPYTYTISAENGATTSNLLTGISVQADATGPTAPTLLSADAW